MKRRKRLIQLLIALGLILPLWILLLRPLLEQGSTFEQPQTAVTRAYPYPLAVSAPLAYPAGALLPLTSIPDPGFVVATSNTLPAFPTPGAPPTPAAPTFTLAGSIGSPALRQAYGVRVVGATAYVAAGDDGLVIFDLSRPGGAVLLGRYDTPGFATQVAVAATVAYVADTSSLQIIDVRDPRSPRRIATAPPMSALSLQVTGKRLIVGGGEALTILDIHEPADLHLLGARSITSGKRVVVSDQHVYLAAEYDGLMIVDMHDPAALVELGRFRGTRGQDRALRAVVAGVDIVGSTAYLATCRIGEAGLQIIDVGDPAHPRLLGYAPAYAEAYDVRVVRGVAYIALGNEGVAAYDVRDPAHPTLLRWFKSAGWALDVEVVGDRLYVAANNGGLLIFQIGDGLLSTEAQGSSLPTWSPTLTLVASPILVAPRPDR